MKPVIRLLLRRVLYLRRIVLFRIGTTYQERTEKQPDNSYKFTTTATQNVEFKFRIVIEDIEPQVYSALLQVDADAAPKITTSSPLPEGIVDVAYDYTIAAIGDEPLVWSVTNGSLPGGLGFMDGRISGKPIIAGEYTFTVKVENKTGFNTKTFSIKINKKIEESDGHFLVGTWWSSAMYETSFSRYYINSCKDTVYVNSIAAMQAYHADNFGVITFTSDGKFQYKVCGRLYEGTYHYEGGYSVRLNFQTQHTPCSNQLVYSNYGDYPIHFCGNSYKKANGDTTEPFLSVSPLFVGELQKWIIRRRGRKGA